MSNSDAIFTPSPDFVDRTSSHLTQLVTQSFISFGGVDLAVSWICTKPEIRVTPNGDQVYVSAIMTRKVAEGQKQRKQFTAIYDKDEKFVDFFVDFATQTITDITGDQPAQCAK